MKKRLEYILDELNRLEDLEDNLKMVPLYDEAVKLSTEIYGEYNLKTLEILNNYGGHLRNLGLYEKAEALLRQGIICAEKLRGSHHPDYATSLVNLANLLRMMKRQEESEDLFQKALCIYSGTIGNGHFLYAGAVNNLGLLYQEMGKWDAARDCFLDCLRVLSGKAEYKIPYAITLHNLVDIYKAQGNDKLAELTLRREIAAPHDEAAGRERGLISESTLYL